MSVAAVILGAKNVGVRNIKNHLCQFIRKQKTFVITEYGEPTSVLMPYNDVIELVDILDELQDSEVLKIVAEGRKTIKKGAKGILSSKVFKKLKAKK